MYRTSLPLSGNPAGFIEAYPNIVPLPGEQTLVLGPDVDLVVQNVSHSHAPLQGYETRDITNIVGNLYQRGSAVLDGSAHGGDTQKIYLQTHPSAGAINQLSTELGGTPGVDVPLAVYVPGAKTPPSQFTNTYEAMHWPLATEISYDSDGAGDFFYHDRGKAHLPALWGAPKGFWGNMIFDIRTSGLSDEELTGLIDRGTMDVALSLEHLDLHQVTPDTEHTRMPLDDRYVAVARWLGISTRLAAGGRISYYDFFAAKTSRLLERATQLAPLLRTARMRRGLPTDVSPAS